MNKEAFWQLIHDDLRPFIAFYLEVNGIDDQEMQRTLSKIVEQRCEYTKKCENARRTLFSMEIDDSKRTKPVFNYVYQKLQKLQAKIDTVKEQIHQKTNDDINHFLDLMTKAINAKLPISIDIKTYMKERYKVLFQDKELLSLSKKIACLEHYQMSFSNHSKFLKFDSDVLTQALVYGTTNNPSNHNLVFDELLGDYLRDTENGRKLVEKATAEITESLNCLEIIPYVKEFGMHLHLTDNDQFHLLENALMRAIFNSIYIERPSLFTHQPELPQFLSSCARFVLETPNEMNLNKSVLEERLYDMPFSEVIKVSPKLMEASEVIESITFLIDPMEILDVVKTVISLIEQAIKVFMKKETKFLMAWDDWFGIFSHILAYSPPSNAVAVVKLLKRITGINMDHLTQYNYNMLISAVDFLLESELEK